MKKWGKQVEEVDYPYGINDEVYNIWCADESTIYYCPDDKYFYIHKWRKRKPVICKTAEEVTNYYLQFLDEDSE